MGRKIENKFSLARAPGECGRGVKCEVLLKEMCQVAAILSVFYVSFYDSRQSPAK